MKSTGMVRRIRHARRGTDGDLAAQALERMELIRTFEERLLELFSEGKLFGTTHTCIGQETCAVAALAAIDGERDIVVSNHRSHGHFLAYGDDVEGLVAEIMGRQTGVCGGRGGSQHLCSRNFYSNGVLGGTLPVAAGVALAEKRRGTGAVTVCFLGDGTLGEGVVYETLNLASLWRLPIVFVLEHNGYAQSTPTAITTAGQVTARAEAFAIAVDRRAGEDPVALTQHMAAVLERVRSGEGPFFQILDTYRLAAHSKGDDDRPAEEIERHRRQDSLLKLRERVGTDRARALAAEAHARVEAAVAAADAAPMAEIDLEKEEELFLRQGIAQGAGTAAFPSRTQHPAPLVAQRLNEALHTLMAQREDVLLIGEDLLDPYGGAFKVSRGLSTRFPDRVLATPVSEAAIVGLGVGLSVRGFRPIVEIMFGDFLPLAADQIVNCLAKFGWMYNGQVQTPVVVRAPVGGGRGYGPTHSQCLEKMFFGVPGLVVVAVSLRHDPGELLRRAVVEDSRPVLFIEQKVSYAKRLRPEPPLGKVLELGASEHDALYPSGTWRPMGVVADLTIVTYGAMTEMVEEAMMQAFETEELVAEYLVVSQLAPLRIDPIVESVRRTGRLLVVEEGTGPWGFGTEVLAQVVEALPKSAVRARRVGAHSLPIPNARPAEELVLPTVGRVLTAMQDLVQ